MKVAPPQKKLPRPQKAAPIAQVPVVASGKGDSSFPELAKKFSKGVVQILVVKASNQWLAPQKPPIMEEVSGSGFLVDNRHLGPELHDSDELHIVTNAHVAINAVRISLRLPKLGLLPIPASIVGLSPPDEFDLALLRVEDPKKLRAAIKRKIGGSLEQGIIHLPLGDSDKTQSGEKLMALGYPEGLPGVKSTLGVMSGYQQMGHKLYMQMTTPINPGNSGGPLLSHEGNVVGVNTAGLEQSQNIGFSIPSAVLAAVLPVLVKNRVFARPTFGIMLNPTSEHQNRLFAMPKNIHGEYISKVIKGSAAHKAGLRRGDVLYELQGMPVTRFGQMFLKAIEAYVTIDGLLGRAALGSKIKMKVWRNGKSKDMSMLYDKSPALKIPMVYEAATSNSKPEYQIKGGLIFTQLTQNYVKQMTTPVVTGPQAIIPAPHLLKYATYPHNDKSPKVVIADVASSSLAEATKVFSAAEVVHKINKQVITTMEELCDAMQKPIKDAKGDAWLTIELEDGTFGAMPMDAADENDRKLEQTGLYHTTKCAAKKGAAAAKVSKSGFKATTAKAKAVVHGKPAKKVAKAPKAPKKAAKKVVLKKVAKKAKKVTKPAMSVVKDLKAAAVTHAHFTETPAKSQATKAKIQDAVKAAIGATKKAIKKTKAGIKHTL
jgi:serine protease Do